MQQVNRHLPHTTVLARIWMRCTHPALASEIRRGRSILTRLAAAGDGKQPCSMDAMYIGENDGKVYLVEFKRDKVLSELPKPGANMEFTCFQDASRPRNDVKGNYYHWLCRKMTDTVLALASRGMADLEKGAWRRKAIAIIVIDAERNGLTDADPHGAVAAKIRRAALEGFAFPELRGYLFDRIMVMDERAFQSRILPGLAPDPVAWVKKRIGGATSGL